jgi:tetratricopeptide (TPR) repeat protein
MIPLLLACLLVPPGQDAAVSTRFRALFDKNDRDGCAALWREKPSLALATIEEELDLASALRAKAKDADTTEIVAHERRASWGAAIARDALGAPLIADFAAARIGWTERERGYSNDERAIHERAKAFLEKGENRQGIEAAQEAAVRALQLGDWHAAALAYETCAIGDQAVSAFDDALVAWNQARVLHRELRLADREIACLRGALDLCFATERPSRGREIATQAAVAAHAVGDRKSEVEFLNRRAGFEEKLGLGAEAAASRKEAKELEK